MENFLQTDVSKPRLAVFRDFGNSWIFGRKYFICVTFEEKRREICKVAELVIITRSNQADISEHVFNFRDEKQTSLPWHTIWAWLI